MVEAHNRKEIRMNTIGKRVCRVLLILVLLTPALLIGCKSMSKGGNSLAATSTYDRVISTGTIRCGYIPYPPGSYKDPNTGKLSGVFVETMEEAARKLDLKVEWTEEVGWATMIEGLQSNRYDMVCTPVWENATRGKVADFSVPLYYSGIGVFTRVNESRFVKKDGSLDSAAINSKGVRISTSDGDIAQTIVQEDYPNAQQVAVSQMADRAQMLLNVTEGKADIAFNEPQTASEFSKKNPNKLKNLVPQNPVRIFPNVMMFKRGEPEFKAMINSSLQEVINSGYVDKLLDKYEPFPGATYRLAYPYRQTAATKTAK
jgi:polar amino acid transport system substrate-binding protein